MNIDKEILKTKIKSSLEFSKSIVSLANLHEQLVWCFRSYNFSLNFTEQCADELAYNSDIKYVEFSNGIGRIQKFYCSNDVKIEQSV